MSLPSLCCWDGLQTGTLASRLDSMKGRCFIHSHRRTAALFALASTVAFSCTQSGAPGTPGPSSGPAFEVAAFREEPCRSDVCVHARIQNKGDRAGRGNCQLLGITTGANGDESIEGPSVTLPVVEPGASVDETLRWTGNVPNGGLRLLCEPALQS